MFWMNVKLSVYGDINQGQDLLYASLHGFKIICKNLLLELCQKKKPLEDNVLEIVKNGKSMQAIKTSLEKLYGNFKFSKVSKI